ncbi:MAG: DUF4359 domain-containing protein [Cyanothece sp. SIO2G6]|nr:DUF4359 domain-containing protein [Cyanothece sp. SIO2G6]
MATKMSPQLSTFLTTVRQQLTPHSIIAGFCILAGVSLMISNPSRSDYTSYAANRLRDRLSIQCDHLKGNLQAFIFSMPMQDVCEMTASGVDFAAAKALEPVVNQFTQPRKYYVLFSVYTTDVPLVGRFNTVAIGGQFITWEVE